MNQSSAKMVDSIFPKAPIRQWVLSFPISLRYKMAYDPKLTTRCLRIFTNKVMAWYRRQARRSGISHSKAGGITVIQRAGGALNLNVHFHSLFIDGVFYRTPMGHLRFTRIPGPSEKDLAAVVMQASKSISRPSRRSPGLRFKNTLARWHQGCCF